MAFNKSYTGFMQLLMECFSSFVIVFGFFGFLNVGLDLYLFLQTRWMAAHQTATEMGSVWPDTVTASRVSWVQTVPKVRDISWRIRLALNYSSSINQSSFIVVLLSKFWWELLRKWRVESWCSSLPFNKGPNKHVTWMCVARRVHYATIKASVWFF